MKKRWIGLPRKWLEEDLWSELLEIFHEDRAGLDRACEAALMDGKPLRYRLTADGHFVLYSVGLNCVDDGGTLLRHERRESSGGLLPPGPQQATHLVWPRPASTADIQAR